jgi:hypothetical protein
MGHGTTHVPLVGQCHYRLTRKMSAPSTKGRGGADVTTLISVASQLAIRVNGRASVAGFVVLGSVNMHGGMPGLTRGLRVLSGGCSLSKCGRGQNRAEANEGKKLHGNLLICGMAHIATRKYQARPVS